nr:cytochrome P450 monooxygenase CYP6TC1 [Lasioderma serricorne]
MWNIFSISIAFGAIIVSIYLYITNYSYNYFKRKGIPYIQPTFPFGNGWELFSGKKHSTFIFKEFYDVFKKMGAQIGGIYTLTSPTLVTIHLDIVRTIIVKDFDYFNSAGGYYNEEVDPLSANMLNLHGEKWKTIRSKLTPTFTSGKMKQMFDLVKKATEPFERYLDSYIARKEPVEARNLFSLYTVDSIGSCVFGLDCNSFEDQNHQFLKMGQRAMQFKGIQIAKSFFAFSFPDLAKRFRIKLTPDEVEEFFYGIVRKTIDVRRKTETERKDFIQLMMGLLDGKQVNFAEVVAESFLFFIGGFDTSATTGSFALFELAMNQEIQDRARNEVMEVIRKNGGELTYDAIQDMKYVEQVIDETLRKHPAFGLLIRSCVKDYKIPDTEIVIDKGTQIIIPIHAFHHDPEYFPNPDLFDPERFNDDNKNNIVPSSYLPFGDGPRKCLGLRFGLMQAKLGLVRLLMNYKFKVNSKTKLPLEFNVESIALTVEGGIWLDIEKI